MSKAVLGLNCRAKLNGSSLQCKKATLEFKQNEQDVTNFLSGGDSEFVVTTTRTELTMECIVEGNELALFLPSRAAITWGVYLDTLETSGFEGRVVLLEAPITAEVAGVVMATFKGRVTGPVTKLGGVPTYSDAYAT